MCCIPRSQLLRAIQETFFLQVFLYSKNAKCLKIIKD
jgi:hypothetical protein